MTLDSKVLTSPLRLVKSLPSIGGMSRIFPLYVLYLNYNSQPHPIFVILLVGNEEIPFGIQKSLLCAKSPHFRHYFNASNEAQVEHIIKLPTTTVEAFGCLQNFLFTGKIYDKELAQVMPEYSLLLDVWKLATQVQIPPLRVAVSECHGGQTCSYFHDSRSQYVDTGLEGDGGRKWSSLNVDWLGC